MLKIPVIDDLGTNLRIPLGQQGEDKAVTYLFDCSEWAEEHPDGVAVLHITRAQDKEEYLAVTSQNNAEVTWVVSNADTAYAGTSLCQLEWVFGNGLSKSFIFKGTIAKSLNPGSEPPTEITQRWVDKLIEEAYKINKAVEDGVTEITDLSSDEMKKIGVVAEKAMTGINTLATDKKNELEGIKSDADAIGKQLLKDAEDGKFDGKDGDDGHTPVKGKDYFTESEIDSIVQSASEDVKKTTYDKETIDKKISAATPKDYDQLKVEVSNKVDKISGKGLSTNDYDAVAKSKVDAIPSDPKYTDTLYDDTEIRSEIDTTKEDLVTQTNELNKQKELIGNAPASEEESENIINALKEMTPMLTDMVTLLINLPQEETANELLKEMRNKTDILAEILKNMEV